MKNELYRLGDFCRLLGIKKQRFQYIALKLPLWPTVEAEGTGTFNLYSFEALLECAVAQVLSNWGVSFKAVRSRIELIKNNRPEFFESGESIDPKRLDNHLFLIEHPTIGTSEPFTVMSYEELSKPEWGGISLTHLGVLYLNLTLIKLWAMGEKHVFASYPDTHPNLKSKSKEKPLRKIRV